MVEDKKVFNTYIFSDNKSFCRRLTKWIVTSSPQHVVSQPSDIQNLIDQIHSPCIIIIDEENIAGFESNTSNLLISKCNDTQSQILYFTNFRKAIPNDFRDCREQVSVVSKSLNKDEFLFHIDTFGQRLSSIISPAPRIQDRYLETIIQIQNQLLANPENSMVDILALIGKVTRACKVTIFENKFDYQERLLMSEAYSYIESGLPTQNSGPLINLLPYQPNYIRWEKELSAGRVISGGLSDIPNTEKPLLKTHGIQQFLLLPIIIKGNFWGFVMLSICLDHALWHENEISLIKSCISPITSFLEIKIEEKKRGVSDERLRRIFENSNIGLVLATKEGALKSFNPAFSSMLGYSENELKNLSFRVFSHPDDLGKELPLLHDLLNGKIPFYLIEKRFIKKGGSVVWVKLNVSAYSREKGKPESLIGIAENITHQKETEKALLESEDRYRKLSDLSMEGILIHQNGIAKDCNERMLAMSGYTREELIGKKIIQLLADRDSIELVKSKIKNNDLGAYEAWGKTKSGKRIPVEIENRFAEYNGEKLRVSAFRDISERKKNEQEIRKLNTAIIQSPSSIVITSHGGNIEYVNKAFCEVTGYTPQEAIGNNPRILKTDYHPKEYYTNLWKTIALGRTWRGIFRNKTKGGDYYWERAVISPIFDENNKITHYLAIKENITQEKIALEALNESEERHRIISELTNDFVYSATIEGHTLRLEWASGSLESLTSRSINQINMLQYGWYSCVLEVDFIEIVMPALQKLSDKKVLNLEYRIHDNNKLKWVSDNVKLIADSDTGKALKVIGAIQDITQKKEASLALDQSKQYLDSIIDNLPIGLQIFDQNGYSARINETQRKLIGISNTEDEIGTFNILTDSLSKITGSDKLYRQVYENKITINRELQMDFSHMSNKKHANTGLVTINEIIFPILEKDGNVHSVISLNTDISKRVESENALKASEMHQKALLKIIPDIIFVFTSDGIFKDVYTEDSGKLLIPAEQFLGKPFETIFPGHLSEKFHFYLHKAVETGEMQSYNYELDVNGVLFYYETRLRLSKENEVIAIIRDVTDSIVAERALKESEEKFRELAERTQDALILISANNDILYASPNLQTILGISPETYAKYPLKAMKLIHAEDKQWVIPELNNYRKGKQASLDMQFKVILKSGELKWIWYRENTVYDENNIPVRYAAVITDITRDKIGEAELKLAKEEAEKANRSKSAFLANVSHEIRTPMNAVLGFSDLLYSRIHDPVLKGYLNSIKSSGKTLLNLLNDILDLSKIEADKMRINLTPTNLRSIIDEVKHIFSLRALEKGLDYTFYMDKDIPSSLMLDELRLKQILLNLIDNAIKFTEQGTIKVDIRQFHLSGPGNKINLKIAVEDTGIGIPLHLQESIFESFRQQDDQDKKKYQGTGLGLAITKRLVQLLNGEIKLKSQPKKGSRFEVTLNNVEISVYQGFEIENVSKKMRFDHAILKDKVIVLLEEEKSNRDLIKEVFFDSESIVIEGENLSNVLHLLSGKEDLILMEISNEAAAWKDMEKLQNSKLANIPRIGITSMLDSAQIKRFGFNATLTKPIDLHKLVAIVSNLLIHNEGTLVTDNDIIPTELINQEILSKVIILLEGEHYQHWESMLNTSSFTEIENFAQNIKQLGLKYKLQMLQSFSDVLVMHAKNFDIDSMNEVLKSYPKIIRELKKSI